MKTTNLFKAVAFVAMTIVSVMNTEVKAQENSHLWKRIHPQSQYYLATHPHHQCQSFVMVKDAAGHSSTI